jgi:hypothetical protein
MSDTVTHARGAESPLHPITGEPPGIKEILERRAAEGNPPAVDPPEQPKPETEKLEDDPAAVAAREIANARRETSEATARLAESERARIAAENARQAAVQGAEDNGFTAIITALASAEREKETLTAEMKTAGEAGDFSRMAEISARLGEIGGDIRELRQGKQAAETGRQERLTQPTDRPRQQEPVGTATERQILSGLRASSKEAFLASRTPQTRDFLYQFPDFFTDPSFHQRMVGAESLARGKGLAMDTPAYFDAIREAALGQTTTPTPPRRETQSSTPPGTPPSREAPSPSGRQVRSGDVYVSQDDKTTAEWMGVDPVEYVQERQRLQSNNEWPYRRR